MAAFSCSLWPLLVRAAVAWPNLGTLSPLPGSMAHHALDCYLLLCWQGRAEPYGALLEYAKGHSHDDIISSQLCAVAGGDGDGISSLADVGHDCMP